MSQDFQARFVQVGDTVDYTPGSAVDAGAVVVVGQRVGITKIPIAASALGALAVVGVFDVVKVNGEITDGASLYWDEDGDPEGGDAGSGAATTTSGGNTFMGFAVGAAAAADEIVRAHVVGVAAVTANHYGPLNNLIADPGDAGAIPVTASGRVELVTGGAETRTLAAPTFGGQELLLGMKTDGGNGVITVTGCDDGNTVTFANTGEMVRLVGVAKAVAFVWRVVADPDTIISTV